MSTPADPSSGLNTPVQVERTFRRFTLAQRWEHALLFISVTVLLLTGLPQKYQNTNWSQWIISTPGRLDQLQSIHHIFAVLLIAEVVYHLGRGIYLLARRALPGEIFPTWKDVQDAWKTFKFLLFLSKEKPKYGKYNFEQKFTYWFLFFAIGIMVISGLILWFPIEITRILPGGIVPAAFLSHSNEAIAAALFILIWHFYHVHLQRLNLSVFTGRLSEDEMQEYHQSEYERLTASDIHHDRDPGGSK
jgi:formate dehydrogenase gamma subunit